MPSRSIMFSVNAWELLKQLSESAYPFEGCGLLLGPLGKKKEVNQIVTLPNTLRAEGRGRFDFSFSPKDFLDAQIAAEKQNLDVIGIFHTHPDHSPRPSKTDEGQPMLAGWINIIASVHGGKFKEAKAWWREDETKKFDEIELIRPV